MNCSIFSSVFLSLLKLNNSSLLSAVNLCLPPELVALGYKRHKVRKSKRVTTNFKKTLRAWALQTGRRGVGECVYFVCSWRDIRGCFRFARSSCAPRLLRRRDSEVCSNWELSHPRLVFRPFVRATRDILTTGPHHIRDCQIPSCARGVFRLTTRGAFFRNTTVSLLGQWRDRPNNPFYSEVV